MNMHILYMFTDSHCVKTWI